MVAGDRRCFDGGREKGGGKVGRSLRGRSGSRFHLVVDASGIPLAIEISAGNEHEQHFLLPLIDRVCAAGRSPVEVWADRGYDAARLRDQLRQRGIEPMISKRRRAGDPIPEGTPTREVWKGRKRYRKVTDPNGRHRWPVERTNSWLRAWRRVDTRWERRPELWLAAIQLAAAITAYRMLEPSFR